MGGHARLGPSNHRWPHCPGSIREEANYTDVSGEAAIDGTGSHLLLEMCLDNNVLAIQYDQQIIGANHPDNTSGWLVGIDRCERVQMCLDYVQRRAMELKEEHEGCSVIVETESKADPGGMFGRDDWYGTCDVTLTCVHLQTNEVMFIEVIDYKDGRGWVHVKNNSQLLSYLAGKMRPYVTSGPDQVRPFKTDGVKGCRMTIVQPKTNPVVRYQCSTNAGDNLTPKDVLDKVTALSVAAKKTDDHDAPCFSGKHCQWCKANPKRGGHCVTATEKSIKVVTKMFEEVGNTDVVSTTEDNTGVGVHAFEYISKVVSDPRSLTSEQLSELMSSKEALMSAYDKCETEIVERLNSGQHISGYAMQPGRSSKKWNESEEEIAKKLKAKKLKLDDIYPKKLISPAQALKLDKLTDIQKKKLESELISVVDGKLTLKKVSHSVAQSDTDRLQSVQEMFKDVSNTNVVSDNGDEISFF